MCVWGGGKKLYAKLLAERRALELLKTMHIQKNLVYLRQRSWRNSPRAIRALVRRDQRLSRIIIQLKRGVGDMVSSSSDILKVMVTFYSNLYASTNPAEVNIAEYLKGNAPTMLLTAEHRNFLDQSIEESEILSVITSLHTQKAPGDDGFTAEFYKAYRHLLAPKLLLLFNQILRDGVLPHSWRQSNTITILKPNRDPTLPASYWPISLINQDAKIFTEVLANRVKRIIHSYVHADQTGFIPGKDIEANIRRMLNTIVWGRKNKVPSI